MVPAGTVIYGKVQSSMNVSAHSSAECRAGFPACRCTGLSSPVFIASAMLWLASLLPGVSNELGSAPSQVITTNYIIVTNVMFVTNQPQAINHQLPTNSTLPALDWVPPTDNFDWMQLKSGEWLKGRLKAMQDRTLEFFSEELGDLSFDWKDIRQLRSPRTLDVLSITGQKSSGPISITPQQVAVNGTNASVFPRDQLQSLTPGGSKERNLWSGHATLGLTLRDGNTRGVEYNAQLHLQRRTPDTRLSLDYIGNVSSVDGVESANNHRINSEFDLWLSQRFYLVLPGVEYYKDPFQNLKHRLTGGVGIGYDIIDRPKMEWNITTGPAYQYAWFDSTEPGDPTEKGTGALTFGSRFKWDITHRIKGLLEYRGQYTSRQVGETTHHSVSTLSLELTKRFDLDVSLVWDRISNPKVGADGVPPKADDFRLMVGLGVDF